MTIFIITTAILLIWLIFIMIRCAMGRAFLRKIKEDSLIIFGKKGKGKTLLCSEMNRMDKKGYLSNTDFKRKRGEIINPSQISVSPNTWEDVLNGKIVKIEHKNWEGKPVYLDDAGIYFPNFADSMLKKKYPSMPIAFAVWRHLYNAPIHINSQDVNRVWKMLKEQQNGAIQCRKTVRVGPFAFIHCTYYSNLESASKELLPMKESIFNKYNKAELNLYTANNGVIKDFIIFAPTWRNKYDSRYFRSKFFDEKTLQSNKL